MRKALIIGLNDYFHISNLSGCKEDAIKMESVLSKNGDGSPNFECKLLINAKDLTTEKLVKHLEDLFIDNKNIEIVLFYFSGHGAIDSTQTDSYIVTSDAKEEHLGISLQRFLKILQKSNAQNKIVILDSCFSGSLGNLIDKDGFSKISQIPENTTFLLASMKDEVSIENNNSGIFTNLLVESLTGGASNILGQITPANIYAYIDKALGSWDQRPIFLTHSSNFVSLKNIIPPIEDNILRKITEYFVNYSDEFNLNPSFEHTDKSTNPKNVIILKHLQKFERVGLVVPVNEEHMYDAAMNSKSCKLTALGYQYWKLVKNNRI